jgi:hypothetical protein
VELRDRLSRLGYFGNRPAAPAQTVEAPPSPAPPRPPPRRSGAPDVHELIPGAHRECVDGRCFVGEATFPLDHAHGGIPVSDLFGASRDALALLGNDARLGLLDLERTVLLDTETTGLAGGTGTFVFLIGLGYFADGAFRVEQYFLRDPSEERAMLRVLGQVLERFETVVTFNGKCFDWPLIETRHLYTRMLLRPNAPLHLDLLYPARRLFKRRVGSCSLGDLEGSVLGMPPRVDDVPGWLIPQIYFDYLRSGDARPLRPVFDHNRRDILTMLSLAVLMARQVEEPLALEDPVDLYSLGRLFEDAERLDRAIACYERALGVADRDLDRTETLTRLSGAYKRLRDAERAIALWEEMVAAQVRSIYPYVELAKHLEHKQKDAVRALELTRRAMSLHAGLRQYTTPSRYSSERGDLEKRLIRLERKAMR